MPHQTDCTVITHGATAYVSPETDRAVLTLAQMGIDTSDGTTYPMQRAALIVLALLDAGLSVETHLSH